MATWIFIFTIITILFSVSDQSLPSTGPTGAPIVLIPGSRVSIPSDPIGPDGLPIILTPTTEAPNDEQVNPDQTPIEPIDKSSPKKNGRPIVLVPGSQLSIPSDPRGPDGSPIILAPPTAQDTQKNGVPILPENY